MYNNPMYYNNFFPYQNGFQTSSGSFLKKGLGLIGFRSINWSNLLNNTQKTLNVINQAIPVYYQVKPIWSNAKTMFRMVSALKDDNKDNRTSENNNPNIEKKTNPNGPVFFL